MAPGELRGGIWEGEDRDGKEIVGRLDGLYVGFIHDLQCKFSEIRDPVISKFPTAASNYHRPRSAISAHVKRDVYSLLPSPPIGEEAAAMNTQTQRSRRVYAQTLVLYTDEDH